mmetsp:Transcript_39751/g.104833  ORF Transcript_39751/g.104833 Transcript_39751/m.104833 type:complete len:205 (-) Transcript_39751:201-815(-)
MLIVRRPKSPHLLGVIRSRVAEKALNVSQALLNRGRTPDVPAMRIRQCLQIFDVLVCRITQHSLDVVDALRERTVGYLQRRQIPNVLLMSRPHIAQVPSVPADEVCHFLFKLFQASCSNPGMFQLLHSLPGSTLLHFEGLHLAQVLAGDVADPLLKELNMVGQRSMLCHGQIHLMECLQAFLLRILQRLDVCSMHCSHITMHPM